jgi:hypothetical protein
VITAGSDEELARSLRDQVALDRTNLLVVANRFIARIFAASPATPDDWKEVGYGDVAEETTKLLTTAAKSNRLWWIDTTETDLNTAGCQPDSAQPVDAHHIKDWQKARDRVTGTGGRQGEVDAKTKFEVASQAAWRCQFDGCGEDLRHHLAPGRAGNYGYYAHIIASSSDGPRGEALESPRLANDPTNILLMCDKCHRLIDRIAPDRYTTDVLREMREQSIVEVRRLLESLRYPTAQMLVIGGNIEGQSFAFDERVAEEAMWLRSLRTASLRAEWFARNGAHLGASNSPGYWLSLFELLKTDIPRLRGMLTGTSYGGAQRPPLAIFPLHGTSVLVLSGRLIGDSSPVNLFQFHRDQVGGERGAQWAWPNVASPANEKFRVFVHRSPQEGDAEAMLQVNLTASIPGSDLPEHLYTSGAYVLPTIEVTVESCTPRCIEHIKDLELLGRALDDAFMKLQDQWRIRKVHLVVIAPVTACVRIGQKMQARHHADFVLYERLPSSTPGTRGAFVETIEISSTKVRLATTGDSIDIS